MNFVLLRLNIFSRKQIILFYMFESRYKKLQVGLIGFNYEYILSMVLIYNTLK